MQNPDKSEFGMTPREVRGKLWMTRNDHKAVNSASGIDLKFGDDVPKGDTLNDEKLKEYYTRELNGIKSMLSLPPDQRKIYIEGTDFLDPEYYQSELEYYRKRGMEVADGEALLEQLKCL